MKICLISTTVFKLPVSGYAGLEQLVWQQAVGLAKKGHEVAVVAPDGSQAEGCEIIPCGPPGRVDEYRAYSGFGEMAEGEGEQRKVLRSTHPGFWQHLNNFDVIIDHSWQKWSYLLKQEGSLKAPILGVMHAPVNTMWGSHPPVEKACIVCISKDQAHHYNQLHNKDTRVAYNGIDLDFYKPMTGVKRTDRFLFLARFSTIKGADLACEACKKVGVGLDLVGDTTITNEPAYLEQIKSMCDGKQIRLIGPATRGECVYWFSQAACLLHPNMRFREPFGLAPVEAQACGCPVIAWDYGAMRETVKQGETGFIVESLEELITHIKYNFAPLNLMIPHPATKEYPEGYFRCHEDGVDDPVLVRPNDYFGFNRQRREAYMREWASQFSMGNMVNRYEELCQEAIETGGW